MRMCICICDSPAVSAVSPTCMCMRMCICICDSPAVSAVSPIAATTTSDRRARPTASSRLFTASSRRLRLFTASSRLFTASCRRRRASCVRLSTARDEAGPPPSAASASASASVLASVLALALASALVSADTDAPAAKLTVLSMDRALKAARSASTMVGTSTRLVESAEE